MVTRGARAFVDGIAFVVLPAHLTHLGFSPTQVGAIVAASLLGSALLTLAAGFLSRQVTPRTVLLVTSWIMLTTGIALGSVTTFVPFLLISIVTTLNPSAGDVSPFLPIEQALLSNSVSAQQRTSLFAGYNLVGSLVGAIGALCAGVPVLIARSLNASDQTGRQFVFIFYGLAGLLALVLYSQLPRTQLGQSASVRGALSSQSRSTILKLSALFSLDSFGGGFATQAIFALWMLLRFNVSIESLGALFFGAGIISALSSLVAVRISQRIGLVRTMVFTHIPASVLLVLVALAPNVTIAVTLFLIRAFLSQMDVPVRTSYVMAVVKPEERAAASSITNVPRSLASALPPLAAGWMLDHSTFAWPLLMCAACKITYDVLLLKMFTDVVPDDATTA